MFFFFLLFLGLRTHRQGGTVGGSRVGGEMLQILDCRKIRLWGDCGVGHGVGNLDLLVEA